MTFLINLFTALVLFPTLTLVIGVLLVPTMIAAGVKALMP